MKRRAFLRTTAFTTGLATAVSTAGCLTGAQEYDVGMQSNAFVPDTIEISVGEEVVWKNTGSRNHTVTAYENSLPDGAEYFASGEHSSEQEARDSWSKQVEGGGTMQPDDVFRHTFEVPGTYHYFCIPHEPAGMTGTVVVTE